MARGSGPASTRKQRVRKAFSELDAQRSLLASCAVEWKEIEEHLTEVDNDLRRRFEELAREEEEFDRKLKETEEALDKRELLLSSREQASLQRVQEQKDSAIAAVLEERQKWIEASQRKESKVVSTKEVNGAKVAPEKDENGTVESFLVGNSSLKDGAAADGEGAANVPSAKIVGTEGGKAVLVPEVNVRPRLKDLCNQMDAEGLVNFLVDHRKENSILRDELPCALQRTIDPCRLVLKCLEGYHIHRLDPNPIKDIRVSATRRACIWLLESLALVLADPVLGVDHPVVASHLKESAKEIAKSWKSKLDVHGDPGNAGNAIALDAQAFLQLLATFGIAADYGCDELCKLVSSIARQKQTLGLCRSLGLAAKIPYLVDILIKGGKKLEALSFADAFGIMNKVQPVNILKSYLKDARKDAQLSLKNAPNVSAGQNEAIMKELSALKAVLKAIEEYKLGSEYPTETLHKRVEQLEKSKADRKRAAAAVKSQAKAKRPRLSGSAPSSGFASSVGAGVSSATGIGISTDKGVYRQQPGQYGGVASSQGLPAGPNFDSLSHSGFSSTYNAGSRSPMSLSRSHLYPPDGMGSVFRSTDVHRNLSGTYGGYQYSNTVAPPLSNYQASFMH